MSAFVNISEVLPFAQHSRDCAWRNNEPLSERLSQIGNRIVDESKKGNFCFVERIESNLNAYAIKEALVRYGYRCNFEKGCYGMTNDIKLTVDWE